MVTDIRGSPPDNAAAVNARVVKAIEPLPARTAKCTIESVRMLLKRQGQHNQQRQCRRASAGRTVDEQKQQEESEQYSSCPAEASSTACGHSAKNIIRHVYVASMPPLEGTPLFSIMRLDESVMSVLSRAEDLHNTLLQEVRLVQHLAYYYCCGGAGGGGGGGAAKDHVISYDKVASYGLKPYDHPQFQC